MPKKWTAKQHRVFDARMAALKKAGKSAWTPARLAKFQASMAAKKGAKKHGKTNGHANGKVHSDMQIIPLDLIGPAERVKKKYAPRPQKFNVHGTVDISAKQQLAMATLAVLKQILDS